MHDLGNKITAVDLFAGPGGLGEGFESSGDFRIAVSIECDPHAHQTLQLRSFFRQFSLKDLPNDYFLYLQGKISKNKLFSNYPDQASAACRVARLGKLGCEKETPEKLVDEWITSSILGKKNWVLIGGPPCQAYSLVGRARRTREDRITFEKDEKQSLYKEYLRILDANRPAVFVMENVKGILSAKIGGQPIFSRICEDLSAAGYKLYGLTGLPAQDIAGQWLPQSFVVYSENYGIPQARHRVFILGVRNDISAKPRALNPAYEVLDCFQAIKDLPKIWSSVSNRSKHNPDWFKARRIGLNLANSKENEPAKLPVHQHGSLFIEGNYVCDFEKDWFYDRRIGGVCNHEARSHMVEDISRYAFAAAYAQKNGISPSIHDFPDKLLPNHENVTNPGQKIPFADRFRVQVKGRPSSTITCHISKDGHYYIHPDAMQARSLTVREAARLQTFPDNYLFEGPRTEQYKQVGNAVPPLLAKQIAEIVAEILEV
jgi:DNA (cytosine-5)-methyltransferase 1